MLLKCDTDPRPTHTSSSFVKGIPISGGEGTAKRSSVSFTQGFASSTASSARENTARASRGNRSSRAGSFGCVCLQKETSWIVRHCIMGEEGRATQTRHCPHHSLGPLIQGCSGVRGDDWRENLKGNSVWSQVTA